MTVQWGTFKINMISCIMIAMAHNLSMFKSYIPGADSDYFNIVMYR